MDDARRAPGLLVERSGPFAFEFRLQAEGKPRAARACFVSWPDAGYSGFGYRVAHGPRIACVESAGWPAVAVFDIDVAFPLVGPVIRYSGWLAVDAPGAIYTAA